MSSIPLTGAGKSSPTAGPTAEFSGTPTSGEAPLDVSFTDLSTGTPFTWHWEKKEQFGAWTDFAGGGANDPNPMEQFDIGTWSVRLTVTNASGSDSETKTNYIFSAAT